MRSELPDVAEHTSTRNYFKAPDMTLRVTEKCDLSCIHCFAASTSTHAPEELTIEEIQDIMDWAYHHDAFRIGITGGEPTLRDDLVDMVRYAKERMLWTMVTTNGFSLTEELCRGLKDSGVDQVDVSLDNSTAEAHDHFRGCRGSFARATKAVEMLVSHDIPTAITCVVSAWNVEDLHSLYRLARELGATFFKVDAFIAVGRGEKTLALAAEQFKSIYEWMDTLHDEKIEVERFSDKFDFLYPTKRSPSILETLFGHKGFPVCEAGITRCSIMANGTVVPCSYFCTREFYAGNVREQSLDEIWNESDVLTPFRTPHPFEGVCCECEYHAVCRGGCRARAYYMGEGFYGPDPYCWVASEKKR